MLLNEYAQKTLLPCPIYQTVAADKAFVSTVTFNNKQYKGLAMYKRQKVAEQNAAQVALTALLSPEGKHPILGLQNSRKTKRTFSILVYQFGTWTCIQC